jgi:GNAT superfamily N-acetyltransferase
VDLLGYAAVAGGSIERRTAPDAKLRKRLPDYPLPVLRLARLGVDRRAQGLGNGKALVRHVLRLALAQRDPVDRVGVVTDAKPEAVACYDGLGFSRLEGVPEGMLHGDPTPLFLDIATIAAAVDAAR